MTFFLYLRAILSVALLTIAFFNETDLIQLLVGSSLVYILTVYIFKNVKKVFLLALDIFLISIYTYIIQIPEIALAVYALAPLYLKAKNFPIYILTSLALTLFGFYISEYTDWTLFILSMLFSVSIFFLRIYINKFIQEVSELKYIVKKLKEKEILLKSKAIKSKISQLKDISQISSINELLFILQSVLNTKAILAFDIKQSKCYSIGSVKCSPEFLQNIKGEFGDFSLNKEHFIYFVVGDWVFIFAYLSDIRDNILDLFFLREKLNNLLVCKQIHKGS